MGFREIRESKGLTVKYVVDKLTTEHGIAIDENKLNDRERNPQRFDPELIKALCKVYNVEFDTVDF